MAATFRREVLTDGKAAIRVDGAPFSPVWFRVKLLDKDLVEGAAGEAPELLVKVAAYQVDATGAVILNGEGPVVRRFITATSLAMGTVAMTGEKRSIAKEAVMKAARSLADIGTIAQLANELVE